MRAVANILWLGTKELRSFSHDLFLLGFVIYSFSFAIYVQAQGMVQGVYNASVAIADEDHSPLSRALGQVLLPPYFKSPQAITPAQIDPSMDQGRYTFALDIPPHFERDVLAGRRPALQVNVDATATMQAGIGAGYLDQVLSAEIARFAGRSPPGAPSPVNLQVRIAFNPNANTAWFTAIMGIINNVTMLAIILAGAAVVREREHGTMDHLLVMPIAPFQIALAKVWANGLVIAVAVALSLVIVVQGLLRVPIEGSISLFMVGVLLYLFFATAIGIFLGTVARSMPQLGLLFMLVALPMNLLSGGHTPLQSMPRFLQIVMQASPSTHFVSIAQVILYRGGGFAIVWPRFVAVAAIGLLFLGLALVGFRGASARAA